VEPIRSQNITLSGRRSAVVSDALRLPVELLSGRGGNPTGSPGEGPSERKAAIATSNRRRWPMAETPSPSRSSAVRWHKSSALTSFSRNDASYRSSPRFRSQLATSTAVSSGTVRLKVRYRPGSPALSRNERRPDGRWGRRQSRSLRQIFFPRGETLHRGRQYLGPFFVCQYDRAEGQNPSRHLQLEKSHAPSYPFCSCSCRSPGNDASWLC
jgi:hypothetical protein